MSKDSLDIKLLEDFRNKFLYFSEGLKYFFEGYEFSFESMNLPSNDQQFSFYGKDPVQSSDSIFRNLRKDINQDLEGFIIPTETIDPQRSESEPYLLQLRRNLGRSQYLPIYQSLSALHKNHLFPIILSRKLRDYELRSPSLPISFLDRTIKLRQSTLNDIKEKSRKKIELIKKMSEEKKLSHI